MQIGRRCEVKLYKLTDENGRTYGGTQWGEGVEHTALGTGELCGPGWLHAYTGSESDPEAGALLAVLLNPIHANFQPPRLFEAEGDVGKTGYGLKVGCTRLRALREIPLPVVTTEQRVRFGILAALEVCPKDGWGIKFRAWATDWLDGSDRSASAAWAAEAEAWAAEAEAEAETVAAWSAARAARAAARAARAASAAAEAAEAAEAAAGASTAVAGATIPLDLAALARRAIAQEGVSRRVRGYEGAERCPCRSEGGVK